VFVRSRRLSAYPLLSPTLKLTCRPTSVGVMTEASTRVRLGGRRWRSCGASGSDSLHGRGGAGNLGRTGNRRGRVRHATVPVTSLRGR